MALGNLSNLQSLSRRSKGAKEDSDVYALYVQGLDL